MGISRRTFYNWRNKYPQLEKVTKLGKEHANFAVENALFKKAINGNTTAMIFWLKNNWRSKYSDSPKTDIELEEVKKRLEIMDVEKQIKQNQLELGSKMSDVKIEFVEVDNDEQDN
ncbi:terminase small subunit [Weissella phage WCP30]|uniref:terminase small subunit n=1 Tax=Weissella phage WCP30 TaxID=1837862 RepID=UPI0008110EAE|nr:terminase small subunit [Weissella phage WCP30]ANU78893.1 small terminase subunit [Weissella phage WCP30]